MKDCVDAHLRDQQAGFRRDRSFTDQIEKMEIALDMQTMREISDTTPRKTSRYSFNAFSDLIPFYSIDKPNSIKYLDNIDKNEVGKSRGIQKRHLLQANSCIA
ncbi:hypothetical protein MS3_00002413 [Schistosoma haematobium]|uniref:Reverse transcriptase domain-containing protein n=1 Tax=Schistosoma haematobium TaxID=6185 RepID=A0A922S7N0_SCHHA|nr:hypothetical protein MS3_00002413 [Schistosoma haematobium]KAH9596882.1 hypothetical protein MS3_00002413 [Schistosoma haematobium]